MSTELNQRQKWEIDGTLDVFIGENVRVTAKSFSPARCRGGEALPRLTPVRDLFLADNSQPDGLPVFFEGRLQHFERQIGVVFVWLDAPTSPETATDGPVYFRDRTAVILADLRSWSWDSPFRWNGCRLILEIIGGIFACSAPSSNFRSRQTK